MHANDVVNGLMHSGALMRLMHRHWRAGRSVGVAILFLSRVNHGCHFHGSHFIHFILLRLKPFFCTHFSCRESSAPLV